MVNRGHRETPMCASIFPAAGLTSTSHSDLLVELLNARIAIVGQAAPAGIAGLLVEHDADGRRCQQPSQRNRRS
jgi:hypothetical protein